MKNRGTQQRIFPIWPALLLCLAASQVAAQTFVRKPFLQKGSPTSASVCWRLSAAAVLTVRYGLDSASLNLTSAPSANNVNACVALNALQPSTRYYYQLYSGATRLTGSPGQYFVTHPPVGTRKKFAFWIIGDAGTGTAGQTAVRDAYVQVNGGAHADGFIMLGDNAYQTGTDAEFTAKVFNVYPDVLANTFAWTTVGNHENMSAGAAPYLGSFYLPTTGESGGLASNSELYYSYDYGNVHFICLDSEISSRSATGPQYLWLRQDLQATRQDWIVAFWHHPPYTWGSHNSDVEQNHIDMRQTFLPLLEQYGVDMVFSGHSHDYERSYLLDSAYGNSASNQA